MVVVVIIGLLAGAVTLVATGFIGQATESRVKSDLAAISTALDNYEMNHGQYPDDLQELVEARLVKSVKDPWGRTYRINMPGKDGDPYEVFTFGRDDREGGEDKDADIYSWMINESEDG
jgi:general secretion pathway protein G